jgi:hypothetical protein
MPKFNARHYVPLLTWKRGEQLALERVPPTRKVHLTPIIELVPAPVDPDTDLPTKTVEEYVGPAIDRIADAWHPSKAFFLDPRELVPQTAAGGVHGCQFAFARAAATGLGFVPVTGPERTSAEIDAALSHAGPHGLCLRVPLSGLAGVADFMGVHDLREDQVDLIIDAGTMQCPVTTAAVIWPALLGSVPAIADWRTVTLLACAFPPEPRRPSRRNLHRAQRLALLARAPSNAREAAAPSVIR